MKKNHLKAFTSLNIVVLLLGFVEILNSALRSHTTEIQMHDTYFVLQPFIIPLFLALLTFILWLFYKLIKSTSFPYWIIIIQTYSYILGVIGFLISFYMSFGHSPKRYYSFHSADSFISFNWNAVMTISVLIMAFSLCIFCLIVLLSIFKRLARSKEHE